MTESQTKTKPQIQLQRQIQAPRNLVFDAWTNPNHLMQWWRCQPHWETTAAEIDLRVGGKYKLGMRNPEDGKNHVCVGTFREIVPNERVSYTWNWLPPDGDVGETIVTVQFRDQGSGTELTLTHQQLPNEKAITEHQKGWNGVMAVLAEYIAQ